MQREHSTGRRASERATRRNLFHGPAGFRKETTTSRFPPSLLPPRQFTPLLGRRVFDKLRRIEYIKAVSIFTSSKSQQMAPNDLGSVHYSMY
ncbi:hypothetical protein NPIL_543741 [Nephila pilipes]|uniref:Uncharacterized protein n=1 Tax=Nephila pilipes TaxID=299642 RepID=A0A8X6NWB0_NEPPI|nr:hypothetical protein NPIL_543741 [Nephila pilipes]